MDDVGRLRERVLKLQSHFGQVNDDIAQVLISADKIGKRSGRIEALEFDDEPAHDTRLVIAPAVRKLEAGE
jgi:DNA recombination protein RmuC